MGQVYQFVWGEVGHIRRATGLARKLVDDVNYAHIETDNYNLEMDSIGIRIEIPPIRPQHKPRDADHDS